MHSLSLTYAQITNMFQIAEECVRKVQGSVEVICLIPNLSCAANIYINEVTVKDLC